MQFHIGCWYRVDFSDVAGNPLFQLKKAGMEGVRIAADEKAETLFTIKYDNILRRYSHEVLKSSYLTGLGIAKWMILFVNAADKSAPEWKVNGDLPKYNV